MVDSPPLIEVVGLHYRYGRHRVLAGVDLTVGRGECLVLFGPNGAGKTTLLRLLATRLRPEAGDYRLEGRSVAEDSERARSSLVYLGHHTHLYGHLTPLENLRFFADLRNLALSDRELLAVVAEVGLGRFADRPVGRFSAGMRKRVALGRVLVAQPALLLLDEPYSALDAAGVAWLNAELRAYLSRQGTIVMVTHDPDRVAEVPHRSLFLRDGRLREEPLAMGRLDSPDSPSIG